MSFALLVIGLAMLVAVVTDVVATTTAISAAGGWLTRRVNRVVWNRLFHRSARGRSRWLRLGGITVLLSGIVVWVVLLWAGWTLVFQGNRHAVLTASPHRPASSVGRAYYAGYTIFTLGNGDLVPGSGTWRLASVMASGSGLFLVTLAITYLVPVVSAATDKRQLAAYLAALGSRPEDVISRAWRDGGLGPLEQHLVSLTPMVVLLAERHRTYPALHYFHSGERARAAAPAVAVLDEALTILTFALADRGHVAELAVEPARAAVLDLLQTLRSAFIKPASVPPTPPSVAGLRAQGVPLVDEEQFLRELETLDDRRRLLFAFVVNDGWSWADVDMPSTATS